MHPKLQDLVPKRCYQVSVAINVKLFLIFQGNLRDQVNKTIDLIRDDPVNMTSISCQDF